jgi:hypothetical protein
MTRKMRMGSTALKRSAVKKIRSVGTLPGHCALAQAAVESANMVRARKLIRKPSVTDRSRLTLIPLGALSTERKKSAGRAALPVPDRFWRSLPAI